MKKALSLVLALVLCLSLCACGAGNNETAIVGVWRSVTMDLEAVFDEDGTGWIEGDRVKMNFTWKFDKELNCYMVATSQTFSSNIQTEGDAEYILLTGNKLYRAEHYEQGLSNTIENQRRKIEELAEGKVKLELDVPYDFGNGVIVTYTDIVRCDGVEDSCRLEVTVEIENNAHDNGNGPILPSERDAVAYLYHVGKTGGSNSFYWSDGESIGLTPTETGVYTGTLIYFDKKITDTIEKYGVVMGIVYFEMNGVEYYVDLSEYFK